MRTPTKYGQDCPVSEDGAHIVTWATVRSDGLIHQRGTCQWCACVLRRITNDD